MPNFFPISLKLKKPDVLLNELQAKKITILVDVRRNPIHNRNSAESYFPENFTSILEAVNIEYLRRDDLGNKTYARKSETYFATFDKLPSIANSILGIHENVGLACYCPEKNQKSNQCHASWLIRYFTVQKTSSKTKNEKKTLMDFL